MHPKGYFRNLIVRAILSMASCLFIVQASIGQYAPAIHIQDFGSVRELYFLDSLWRFHSGPVADDKVLSVRDWDTLPHTAFGESDAPSGWQGIGWFALWIKLDTSLVGEKLSLRINHDGASEIFIDGKPIGGYGKVASSAQTMKAERAPKDIIALWIHDTRPHLLTIHYANFDPAFPDFAGFKLSIGDYNTIAERMASYNQLYSFVPMCAAAQLILGLLHFLLFLFYRNQKLNLYYAIFVMLIAINTAGIYLYYQTRSPDIQFFSEFMMSQCKVLIMWSGMILLHVLNYGHTPRWRKWALGTISLLYIVLYTIQYIYYPHFPGSFYFSIVFFVFAMDGFWSVLQIIRRGQKGAWLIATGVVAVILLYFFAWDDTFQLWPYPLNAMRIFVLSTGQLVLPLCLSLYLALDFASTHQRLSDKLQEVESLSKAALALETEKTELLAGQAKRLEETVLQRTAELQEKADKLREMDIAKSRFFTNITHEFRTPLTLIINPAKELLESYKGSQGEQHLRLILNNANRLLQLINQLLELSKLENGQLEVKKRPMDLVLLIRAHVLSYGSLAKQKDIQLQFESDWDELWIAGDRDKMDKVVLNLLSNAMKFTDRGHVKVSLRSESSAGNEFVLTVRDTGRGIAKMKLPYIFARFYQADPSDTRLAEGTGIGLAVVRELVELMNGEIHVDSVEKSFTSISIRMPYAIAHPLYAADDRRNDNVYAPEYQAPSHPSDIVVDDDKPLILLIEDHQELREFVHQSLASTYRVINAANGEQGIALGLQHIPTLIITDVMMPGVDGYQVTSALKNNEKTSHIPIIMLTAKTNTASRIDGIKTGADAYLGKPFDKNELFALMENLVNIRDQLRKHYSQNNLWFNDSVSMPTIEQEFMTRVRQAVENHLDDEAYGTDHLAMDMGLSRTQLHRKLKALVGQAPGELIRIVRLQRAHDLLARRVATVSEVAYMVGFSSPASFSASFSRHFGFPPKAVDAS